MLIAHLSDPHLRQKGHLYQGLVDSNAMFDLALETLAALDPQPDIVIIGGDLVDEGSDAEYETVGRALAKIPQPVFAIPGEHHGEIDDAASDWLDARLGEDPERPTVLLMHQPPVECGITCIDSYKCFGGDRLAHLIQPRPNVERVLCGHIHRFMQTRFGGTLLMTAPSTATSIALRLAEDAEPASFVEPPAFLLHSLRTGGELLTHWVPVGSFPGPFPFF